MDKLPPVSIGRIVHYRLPEKPDEVRPAVIVRTWGNDYCVQLNVFLDKANDAGVQDFASSAPHESARPDLEGKGGVWFWPPRVG